MIKKLVLGSMQTNCYVVYNENCDCLLVDPGANGQKIFRYLSENELNLKAILLTHGHFDHIGATDYLYQKYHCPIYSHKESLELLKDSRLNLSFYEKPLIVESPIFEAKDIMNISNFQIEWMLLEGHCQGSSMIYFSQEQAIMSGDVLFAGSIGRYDFPTSSHLETKKSMNKIALLEFDARLLPGHGEESTLRHEQLHNPYLNHN